MKKGLEQNPFPKSSAAGKTRVVRGVVFGLLKGTWSGGDRLTEAEAVDRFKVSRTPVREALIELDSMGIVQLRRNCGAVFRSFGEKELGDIYSVRSLLEVEAVRLAATRMDETAINALARSFDELRRDKTPDIDWALDRNLHASIAEAAGNPRLASEIARYGDLVQTIRELVGDAISDAQSTTLVEHLRILRCLKQRDPESAAEAMRHHLAQAASSASAILTEIRKGRMNPKRKGG